MSNTQLFESIDTFIHSISNTEISSERKEAMEPIINYIHQKLTQNSSVNLLFVCTHNSRRSHLSQIWAQVMASYFGYYSIHCYSGGTEVTRMYASVVEVLKGVGFDMEKIVDQDNPIYSIHFAQNTHPIVVFSKKYNHHFNPKSGFASIMTCTDADVHCPIVHGSETRFSLPYLDPKKYDGEAIELEKYHERMIQIASEMYYIFSTIKKKYKNLVI